MMQGPGQLYRHFDDMGTLLYVGVSLSSVNRLGQHKDHSHWFNRIATQKIEHFTTREEALAAETKAIQDENPTYNVHKRRKESDEPTRYELTRQDLVHRILLHPVYTIKEAAELLKVGVTAVTRLIQDSKLGCIHTVSHGHNVMRVTGWQIIDYLESYSLCSK